MKSDWMNEPSVVLDACALIAFFNDEPGAEVVAAILDEVPLVAISAVNLLEIAYDAIRQSGNPYAAYESLQAVGQLPIHIRWDLDRDIFHHAARLKAGHRISLADAFALALAKTLGAPVVTSDHHEFDTLEQQGITAFIWIR
jgi:uncharacterized protein